MRDTARPEADLRGGGACQPSPHGFVGTGMVSLRTLAFPGAGREFHPPASEARRGSLPRPRPRCTVVLATLVLVGAAQMAISPKTIAARGLTTGFYSSGYGAPDESVRDLWFDRTVQANAGVVRINILWSGVAHTSPGDPRNPADPAYNFESVDRAVRGAAERGLQIYFTLVQAPAWAEGPNRPAESDPGILGPGAWKPDPDALGDFAAALARRYSGSFPDPAGGGPLPRVRYYEAWNEPNIPQYLAPQYRGGKPTAVIMYREMLRSVSRAVKGVDKGNLVIGPDFAPYGDPPADAYRSKPFDFLRELFCLKGRKKLEAEKRCPKKQIPTLDIFSAHPIGYSPTEESSTGDAAPGDLDELVKALRVAERAKHIRPRGRRPVWVTEFWWPTSPVSGTLLVVDVPTQARYVAQSLYLHWKAGAKLSTYFGLNNADYGLFFSDGTQKPAFDAFRFPFVVDPQSKGKLLAWGKSPAAGQLEIQQEGPNGWETVKQLAVKAGVFTTKLNIQGPANLRAAIGSDASLPWGI
jgi:hypothetical protein